SGVAPGRFRGHHGDFVPTWGDSRIAFAIVESVIPVLIRRPGEIKIDVVALGRVGSKEDCDIGSRQRLTIDKNLAGNRDRLETVAAAGRGQNQAKETESRQRPAPWYSKDSHDISFCGTKRQCSQKCRIEDTRLSPKQNVETKGMRELG